MNLIQFLLWHQEHKVLVRLIPSLDILKSKAHYSCIFSQNYKLMYITDGYQPSPNYYSCIAHKMLNIAWRNYFCMYDFSFGDSKTQFGYLTWIYSFICYTEKSRNKAQSSEIKRELDNLQLPTAFEVLGLLHHFQPGRRKNAETM